MKVWHPEILPFLPDSLLTALHRDVCALRGRSWGSKSPRVKHLWNHPYSMLAHYHKRVLREMVSREWSPDTRWLVPGYRGKSLTILPMEECSWDAPPTDVPEHTPEFLADNKVYLRHRVIETVGPWTEEDISRVERMPD